MSAALIWIFLPAAAGILITVWGDRRPWLLMIGTGLAGLLALAGWVFPVDEPVNLGPAVFQILPDFFVLGRNFVINVELLRIVGSLYATICLWGFGAIVLKPGRFFIPSSLLAGSFLVGAVSIQPWQFAGIFILLAVLVLVPVLSPPGSKPSLGVIKFISFQTIGVPFFLIAGTLMEGLESIPAGLAVTVRPSILIGFGFAFLLALFPFHAWVPVLFEDNHPFSAAFTLVLLQGSIGIIALQIIDRYLWLRSSDSFFTLIRIIGLLSILIGGVWAASQRHAGRIFGYLALADTGMLLMAIGSGAATAPQAYFPLIAARGFGYFLLSIGLHSAKLLRGSLVLDELQGLFQEKPIVSASIWIGIFSITGIPLFAGFIPKLNLLNVLAEHAPTDAIGVVFGMAALTAAGLRVIAAMIEPALDSAGATNPADEISLNRTKYQEVVRADPVNLTLVFVCILVMAGGIFPEWINRIVESLPLAFTHLSR